MSNSIAPGSSVDVNVRVTALTTNPNVPVTYKTIILKKNLVNGVNTLTQEMMSAQNIKYVIKYDYILGEDITIPANCVLEFDGGSISGAYTLTGQNTKIKAELVKIFDTNITIAGTWDVLEAYSQWFGIIGDGVTDDTDGIENLFVFKNSIFEKNKIYYTPESVYYINTDLKINLNGSSIKGVSGFFINCSSFEFDLNGGTIISNLRYAKVASDFVSGTTLTVEDSSMLEVGQKFFSSYALEFCQNNKPVISNINGNTITINVGKDGGVDTIVEGAYIGDFAWSALFFVDVVNTKSIIIKNGTIKNTPGYFVASNLRNGLPLLEPTCKLNFDNVCFRDSGFDAFNFHQCIVEFNNCQILNTLDFAKQGINYGPNTQLILNNTIFDRHNIDIDIVDNEDSSHGSVFSDSTKLTNIFISGCIFKADSNPNAERGTGLRKKGLHAVNIITANYNTAYFGDIIIKDSKFVDYERNAVGSNFDVSSGTKKFKNLMINNCSFECPAVMLQYIEADSVLVDNCYVYNIDPKNISVINLLGSNSRIVNSNIYIASTNIIGNAIFSNCLIKGIGDTDEYGNIYGNYQNLTGDNVILDNIYMQNNGGYSGVYIGGSFLSPNVDKSPDHIILPFQKNRYGINGYPTYTFKYIGHTTEYRSFRDKVGQKLYSTIYVKTLGGLSQTSDNNLLRHDIPYSNGNIIELETGKAFTRSGYLTSISEVGQNQSQIKVVNNSSISIGPGAFVIVANGEVAYLNKVINSSLSGSVLTLTLAFNLPSSPSIDETVMCFYLENESGIIQYPLIDSNTNRPILRNGLDKGYTIIENNAPIYWNGSAWVDATGTTV